MIRPRLALATFALLTLGATMDQADAIVIPIALACAGWLLQRSGRAPAAAGWLTIATAVLGAALAILFGLGGPELGPVAVVTGWIWLLGIGILLVLKPAGNVVAKERQRKFA